MDLIEVLPTLRMLRFPVGAAYLWRDGDDLTLIDSGTADAAAEIEEELDGGLRRIVLAHWPRITPARRRCRPRGTGPRWWRTGWRRR